VTADEAVVAVLESLDDAGIRYMIVGSLASNFHGIPRSTRDADFVVELDQSSLERLALGLPPSLRLEPQGAFQGVTGTTRYVVALVGHAFVCELFLLSDDPHDRERFARRMSVRTFGRMTYVASAEDMIVTRLRWAVGASRPKDREDTRNILAVQGTDLDRAYLDHWTTMHGTATLLADIKASLPAQEE